MKHSLCFATFLALSVSAFGYENVALGKPTSFSKEARYHLTTDSEDSVQLTDGKFANSSGFWTDRLAVGWYSGKLPVSVTVDLGEDMPITGFSWQFAFGRANVVFPKSIDVYVSVDGEKWNFVGGLLDRALTLQGMPPPNQYRVFRAHAEDMPCHGRYVMFITIQEEYCFCDEIEVYRGDAALLKRANGGEVTGDPVSNHMTVRLRSHFMEQAAEANAGSDLTKRISKEIDFKNFRDLPTVLPYCSLQREIWAANAVRLRKAGFKNPVFWTNCRWENLSPLSMPSDGSTGDSPVVVDMMRGEIRAETVNVLNPTDQELVCDFEVEGLGPDSPLDCREVLFTDTKLFRLTASALKPGSGSKIRFSIPAGASKQVWISVRRPTGRAGMRVGRLVARLSDGSKLTRPFKLRVRDLDFPKVPRMHVGGWDYLDSDGKYYHTPSNLTKTIEMHQEMGVDVPWASSGTMPQKAQFDDEGRLTAPLDFMRWDHWTKDVRPDARQYAVFWGVPLDGTYCGERAGTPRFDRMVGDYLRAWIAHARSNGLNGRRILLLLVDEPSTKEKQDLIHKWMKAIRAANVPEFASFENPQFSEPWKTPAEFWDLCDVVCPITFEARDDKALAFWESLAARGKEVWLYSAHGPSRTFDPISYYRMQAWTAFKIGSRESGTQFWAFGCGGEQGDSWKAYAQPSAEYSPYFVSPTDVMDAKQNEAIREGVEDFEYLSMLAERLGRNAFRKTLDLVFKRLPYGDPDWDAPGRDHALLDRIRIRLLDKLESQPEYDVVVYGSTPAALTAAISAKERGKSVVVISPETRIGGLTTGGLGHTDIGNKAAFGGLALRFYREVADYYRRQENWVWQKRSEYSPDGQCVGANDGVSMWTFEPSAALKILEGWECAYGLDIRREERLDRRSGGIEMCNGKIVFIRTLSGKTYRGKVFVDATYEGDLMAAAGVSYAVGREDNATYGETLNGSQVGQARFHNIVDGVDPYVVRGDKRSGFLPGLETVPLAPDGTGDRRVQAYCFRMCLTDVAENRIPFVKPQGYDERDYELLFRNYEAGEELKPLPWINARMPNRKTDTNNRGGFSTDFIGRNWRWAEGSYEERESILKEHLRYQQGLMWTLANHPRVPDAVRREVSRWGTCKDEFSDGLGNGWPSQLYIREARRLVGDYVMTEANCRHERMVTRPVAMAAYTMDSHHVRRYVTAEGFVKNEGDVEVNAKKGPFGIDYGAIIPKRSECVNLLVPVCLSASHIAFGSIRMEPVFFALGQAAGTAAAMASEGISVQNVDYASLRDSLLSDGQVLDVEETIASTFPVKDLSLDRSDEVVVAAGTENRYQGHPTTVRTVDGRIIAVWCTPHGGLCGPAAESSDGGKSWKRIDSRFPKAFADHANCPSAYRLVGPDGKARIWVWSQTKRRETDKPSDAWSCRKDFSRAMPSVMSEDEGYTWREMPPLGEKFACVMAFSSVVRLKDGSYLGMFHVGPSGEDCPPLRVKQSVSRDGGFTWSEPIEVCGIEGKNPCEPYVLRSPTGDELCCLMRENSHVGRSLMMFSRDESGSWSEPVDTPWALTGDRHQGLQLSDGRLLIAFRDMAQKSPTYGHFVGWVGTYEELKSGRRGSSFRIKIMHNYADVDCGYSGVHELENGMIVVTTYLKYWDDRRRHSVVSKRFSMSAVDDLPNLNGSHVVARIVDLSRYENRHPKFKQAFGFLRHKDLASLSVGRYEIDGTNCWATVSDVKLTPLAGEKVEAHRQYIDIQTPLSGPETIGLLSMSQEQRELPFDERKDIVLFDAETKPATLYPGEFAIFFPPDGAHAPGHSSDGERTIRKLVIKVRQ